MWDMRGGRGPAVFGAKGLQRYNMLDALDLPVLPALKGKDWLHRETWPILPRSRIEGLHLDPMNHTRAAFQLTGGVTGQTSAMLGV